MLNSKLLLVALATTLLPSLIFSISLTITQIDILPNRIETIYELGRAAARNVRIFEARLVLNPLNHVTDVSLNYQYGGGLASAYIFTVTLFDIAGNVLSSGSVCVNIPGGPGSGIITIPLTQLAHVDSVAKVRTTVSTFGAICP